MLRHNRDSFYHALPEPCPGSSHRAELHTIHVIAAAAAAMAGVSTLNPDSFYHAKQSLVLALTQLHAAFKSSTPALASALAHAKGEIEDIGLFE